MKLLCFFEILLNIRSGKGVRFVPYLLRYCVPHTDNEDFDPCRSERVCCRDRLVDLEVRPSVRDDDHVVGHARPRRVRVVEQSQRSPVAEQADLAFLIWAR